MKNGHLLINQPKKEKKGAKVMPNVTPEVEKWGALVTWLRTKNYTPDMVRQTIMDYEELGEDKDVLAGD